MFKDDIAQMESLRLEALREEDAFDYYSLCKRLGYSDNAIENIKLFNEGYRISANCSFDLSLVSRVSRDKDVIDDSILVKALNVIAPPLYRNSNNYVSESVIKKRLREVAHTGYPVDVSRDLRNFELLNFYDELKRKIIKLVRINVPGGTKGVFSKKIRWKSSF